MSSGSGRVEAATAGGLGLALLCAPALIITPGSGPPDVELAVRALCTSAGLAAFAVAGALASRASLRPALGWQSSRIGVGKCAWLAAGTLGVSFLADAALRQSGLRQGSVLRELDTVLEGSSGLPLGLAIAGLGIAPALGEELFFRGFLLRSLSKSVGWVPALLISALAFGAFHLDLAQGLGATFLGLYLGAVAMATGSIWTAIACHMANNLVAVANLAQPTAPGVDGDLLRAGAAVLALVGVGILAREVRRMPVAQSAPGDHGGEGDGSRPP